MSDFVWLRHTATGGVQRFPLEAADQWRAMDWVDTDPPAEPNPALAEYRARSAAQPDPDPSEQTSVDTADLEQLPGVTAQPTTKSTRSTVKES